MTSSTQQSKVNPGPVDPLSPAVEEPCKVGFYKAKPNGLIVEANDVFLLMIGVTQEVLAQGQLFCRDIMREVSYSQLEQALGRLEKQGYIEPFETIFRSSDGSEFNGQVSIIALRDGSGCGAYLVQDITGEKQKRGLLESMFHAAPGMIAAVDTQLCYIAFNQVYQLEIKRNYGLDFKLGDKLSEVWKHLPQEQALVIEGFERALRGEAFTIFRKAGGESLEQNYYEITYRPIKDNGQILGAFLIARDRTEQLRLEEKQKQAQAEILRLNEELKRRFDITFEQVAVGIAHVGAKGEFLRINQKYCDILGYSREEISSVTFAQLTHPDDLARDKALHGKLFSGELQDFSHDKRYIRKDGSVIWVHLTVAAVKDGQGETDYNLVVVEDITERKQAEDALRASEERFRSMANFSPGQIYEMAPDGKLQFMNQTAIDFYGPENQAEIMNGGWINYVHPDDREKSMSSLQLASESKSHFNLELRIRNRSGEYRWFLTSAPPSFASDGELLGFVGTAIDITELKQTEFALRESEERFRILANASPTQVYDMAPDGTFRFINKTVIDFYGAEREHEILQGNWKPYIHPDDLATITNVIQHALETGSAFSAEVRVRNKNEEYRWLLCTTTPSFYPNGEFYGLVGSNLDITERKQAEEALRESEERFRIMANASPAQIFDVAPDGKLRFINKTTLDFYGLEKEQEIRNGGWINYVHPDDRGNLTQPIRPANEIPSISVNEFRIRRKDGEYRWFLTSTAPSFYPNGEMYGLVGTAIDITDRKQMEEALQKSKDRWQELANAVPMTIWVANAKGEVIFVNARWYEYSGLAPEQSLGTAGVHAVHPDDRKWSTELWAESVQQGAVYEAEIRYRSAAGDYRWHLVRAVPVKDTDGHVLNWYGSNIDIQDRRKMEQELAKARDIAEDANRKKSQFLANMSHELRTPLNAVIGFSDMLKKGMAGPLTEKQDGYVAHISTSGRHLLTMVNDILDISKAEAGRVEIFLQYVTLEPFIKQLKELVSFSTSKNQVQVTFEVQSDLIGLIADPDRLKQIFLNLLSNAIKFNKEGGSVQVFIARSPDQQWVVCEIQDTGIGIPQDKIQNLFSEFYQVDSSNSRRYEGTGLGLALTKKLIDLHHGEIAVESQEGIGSTFTFKLPLNPYAAVIQPETPI